MDNERDRKLAGIFLDRSLRVKKGDRVVIMTSGLEPAGLIRECYKGALRRGAHVYLDVAGWNLLLDRSSACGLSSLFYECAQDHHFDAVSKIFDDVVTWGNKFVRITTIDDPEHVAHVLQEKMQRRARAYRKSFDRMADKDWVLTYTPTVGYAKRAGMSLKKFTEFYYDAVLVDYDEMGKALIALGRVIDRGRMVRIKAHRTDLTLGIEGRNAEVCDGKANIPDGEVYTGPEENKTEGHIYFDFPGTMNGKVIKGIFLEFKKGRVAKATSETNQDVLQSILHTDAGARRLGEFAIGGNYQIKRFMYNTLFDEKMGGTIHLALGRSYRFKKGWGRNNSAIHWDIVKDTRRKGSEVWVDEKVVLKDGKILV